MRVLATLLSFMLANAAAAVTVDQHGRPTYVPEWRTIGADPCRDNAACTLEWALAEAEETGRFPSRVADRFRQQLADGVAGRPAEICRGDHFFMSFGRDGEPVFVPYMRAAFTAVECTDTVEWIAYDPTDETIYRLFIVEACGNIGGGRIELFTELPEELVPAPAPHLVSTRLPPTTGYLVTASATPGVICCIGGGSDGSDPDQPIFIIDPDPDPDPHPGPGPGPGDDHDGPTDVPVGVIPVPASWFLLLGGLGLLFARRRRV